MALRVPFLMLLFFCFCRPQLKAQLPNLQKVINSMEGHFKPLRGNLSTFSLPDTAYNSTSKIEGSLDNQIRPLHQGTVYFAFMGAWQSKDKAQKEVDLWKTVLASHAKGFSLKSQYFVKASRTEIGYLLFKVKGDRRLTIDVYYYFISEEGGYSVLSYV